MRTGENTAFFFLPNAPGDQHAVGTTHKWFRAADGKLVNYWMQHNRAEMRGRAVKEGLKFVLLNRLPEGVELS